MGAFVSGMDAGNIYSTWPLMGTHLIFLMTVNLLNLFRYFSAFDNPSISSIYT